MEEVLISCFNTNGKCDCLGRGIEECHQHRFLESLPPRATTQMKLIFGGSMNVHFHYESAQEVDSAMRELYEGYRPELLMIAFCGYGETCRNRHFIIPRFRFILSNGEEQVLENVRVCYQKPNRVSAAGYIMARLHVQFTARYNPALTLVDITNFQHTDSQIHREPDFLQRMYEMEGTIETQLRQRVKRATEKYDRLLVEASEAQKELDKTTVKYESDMKALKVIRDHHKKNRDPYGYLAYLETVIRTLPTTSPKRRRKASIKRPREETLEEGEIPQAKRPKFEENVPLGPPPSSSSEMPPPPPEAYRTYAQFF